jgi:hypothetical protein
MNAGSYNDRRRPLFRSKPRDFERNVNRRGHIGMRYRGMRDVAHDASRVILGVRDSVGVRHDLRAEGANTQHQHNGEKSGSPCERQAEYLPGYEAAPSE